MDNGVLKRRWESVNGKSERLQIVVPRSKRKEILQEYHNNYSGGHLGINKTIDKIRRQFYWCDLSSDVKDWIQSCEVCQKVKARKSIGHLQVHNVGQPWERVAIDVAGPFPRSHNGSKYILVVMDYFSKWVEVYPMPNQEAPTVAQALIENWISRYGVPIELHSDQGTNFESTCFWRNL